jgi:hypothetical protein
MRGMRVFMRWFGALALAVTGCQSVDPPLKPKLPDEYVLPPSDDRRFTSPPEYPKEYLDTGQFKKDPQKPTDPNRSPVGFGNQGMGSGMRGPGGY